MSDYNHVGLSGRLAKDAVSSKTQSGMTKVEFTLCNTEYRGKENGEYTNFFNVVLWDKTAENLLPYLKKGRAVTVGGRLRQDRWDKDGQKMQKLNFICETIALQGVPSQKSEGEVSQADNTADVSESAVQAFDVF